MINDVADGGWPPSELDRMSLEALSDWYHGALRYDKTRAAANEAAIRKARKARG